MGRSVLYIDDAQELPERTAGVLESVDFSLVHTGDPEQALRCVREQLPSLVLIEVLLEACDGFELIEQIAAIAPAHELPVVVVTRGERSSELYGRALELGVRDFLCKPVLAAQILEAALAFGDEATAAPDRALSADDESGDLVEDPLPEVLARLHRTGASGVVTLTHDSETRAVQVRNGSPVVVTRPLRMEPFEDYVLRAGWIKKEQYDDAIDQAAAGIGDIRSALEGMGALTSEQSAQALQAQARDVFLDLFRWASGTYEFRPEGRLPEARTLDLACDPVATLVEGVLRGSPDAVVRAGLAKRGSAYAAASAELERCLERIDAPPEQRARLLALAGDRTLNDELAPREIDHRLIYGLVVAGLLELEEEPMLTLVDVVADAATPTGAEASTAAPAGANSAESWLRELADRIPAQDDFELFGIDENVSDAEAQSAYRKLIESFPPIPPELDHLASRVRARIDQVYGRIRSADLRAAFAGLRSNKSKPTTARCAPEVDGSRAADAESSFRRGQACLNSGDWRGAIEALGMAMHLDPDQGDYMAHLGYALYQSDPGNDVIRREALEHIAKGVKLAPDRATPLLFLGRVFRLTGDAAMAEKVLRRGLKINADHHGLLQELCLVQMADPAPKKKDWLARLRRKT